MDLVSYSYHDIMIYKIMNVMIMIMFMYSVGLY